MAKRYSLSTHHVRPRRLDFCSIAEEEVGSLEVKKAAGPDYLYNEQLKAFNIHLLIIRTDSFNGCMEIGTMPPNRRHYTIQVLYKERGDVNDTSKCPGITLKRSTLKVLTKPLTEGHQVITESVLPDKQFCFRPGRFTLHAVANILGIGCTQVA